MSSDGNAPDSDLVRSCNWSGSIPVILTLAPTSLGTTMMPHPIHLLLNRGTFLHVGLRTAILRLHKFAPATLRLSSAGLIVRNEPEPQGSDDAEDPTATTSTGNPNETSIHSSLDNLSTETTDLPVCWLEDEETQIPLRWHLFAGVLFDMMKAPKKSSPQSTINNLSIPWRIRLHFSNYPSSQLLPLEPDQVGTSIERSFKNSLKQALFLQYGNSKVAMNMSKQIHQRLWSSIECSNYKLYQQINADLQAKTGAIQLIPIRLFVDSKPPIQRPCKEKDDNEKETTLGSLFVEWLPDIFERSTDGEVKAKLESCRYVVAGIAPPMSISIWELWQNLCHPDHFLYMVVMTR